MLGLTKTLTNDFIITRLVVSEFNNISDPPTQTVYVKQYEKVDSFKLDTSYVYEYFKLENQEIYLIRVKKKKYDK